MEENGNHQWEVDHECPTEATEGFVILRFNTVTLDGVESFTTEMLPEYALEFGMAIVQMAKDLMAE